MRSLQFLSVPPSLCGNPHLPYVLPSSVSRKSFGCHSYENCRGVYQRFPKRNRCALLNFYKSSQSHLLSIICANSVPSVLSPFLLRPCGLFCAFLHSPKTQPLLFQAIPHSSTECRVFCV